MPVCRSIEAGTATCLVRVKVHRGEAIKERADDVSDEGDEKLMRRVHGQRDPREWVDDGCKRAFELACLRSIWTNGIGHWIRHGVSIVRCICSVSRRTCFYLYTSS